MVVQIDQKLVNDIQSNDLVLPPDTGLKVLSFLKDKVKDRAEEDVQSPLNRSKLKEVSD